MLSMIGLLLGLALLIVLTMRGVELLIAAPLCALLVALTSGFVLFPQLAAEGAPSFTGAYMSGFTGFVTSWFFMFLLGSLFGKFMEASGAAESVARWIVGHLGTGSAILAVVLACAVLTYGGVSLFVVAFSVYPMALSLFRAADLPRRFVPGAIAFGSVTFTMTSAGSPEIQNWIPIQYLGTSPWAGWQVSLAVAIVMAVLGSMWLRFMVRRALASGERFVARDDDPEVGDRALPHPLTSVLPLVTVLGLSFIFHDALKESALIIALAGGVGASLLIHRRFIAAVRGPIADGALGALIAIANTAAVVGFGGVAKLAPAFQQAVAFITDVPGPPLVGAAIAVTVIAGLTGSASGGQAIALPILAPHYLALGVGPEALHRVVALSSGALDSLPHNGYVVTTIRAICRETYQGAYPAVAALTVIVPLLGTALAVLLFSL
ncbi:MAG: GntP family permease [Steroidobacteraceae bacterium]